MPMRSCGIGPRRHFLSVLTVALALAAPALAPAAEAPVSSIRVTGEARITAKPDRVQIDIGVSTQAPTSQEAAAANARQLEAVLTAVRAAGGNAATLKTVSYTLNPEYQYHPNGAAPTLTGYHAANIVQVTLDDLGKIGAVLDAATRAGANQVQGIRFTLRDEDAARAQALREAAQRARAQAEVLAQALGLKIDRVLQVEENSQGFTPIYRPMAKAVGLASAEPPTPVEAGTLDVSANITLTVEVSPAAR
jgi:uncharacterized protein